VLTETLLALATAASTHLVTAMTADGWTQLKEQVARLLGRGDPDEERRHLDRLDRSRSELAGAGTDVDPDQDVGQAAERERAAWQARFQDLLEETPDAETRLRALVDLLGATGAATAGAVQVNATASGQAQQAVLGQGVQTNTFGARPVPPAPEP
jgi:hypothetical protein